MILKSIRLNNIRSFLDEKIEFPQGSVLLSGNVGAGKSTILLAIDFAFFGTRKGELSGSDLLRHGENHGFVELEFDVDGKEVVIKRALKSGKGIVQDSGSMMINGSRIEYTPMELKARVLELFGYPKDLLKKSKPIFRYTVYTPQEQMKHILLFPDERLETLRKIFDVEKYGRIRDNAKLFSAELRTMKRELDSLVMDLDYKTGEAEKKRIEKTVVSRRLDEQSVIIEGIDEKLRRKRSEMDMIKKEIEDMNRLKQEMSRKETELRMKKTRTERIDKELDDLTKKISSNKELARRYENVTEPETSEKEIRNKTALLEKERDVLITRRAVISDEIARLERIYGKGVCDSCGQLVHDAASFKTNIEKKLGAKKAIDNEIAAVDNNVKDMKDEHARFITLMTDLEKKRHIERVISDLLEQTIGLENEKSELDTETNLLESDIAMLMPMIEAFNEVVERSAAAEKGLYVVQNEKISAEKEKSRVEQQMADIDNIILMLEREIEEKTKARGRITKINELTNWFDSYFINLMMIIEKNVMMAIQKEFNTIFQDWFNMIMADDLTVRIDEQFSPVIEQNGYETEYQNLSGGEKTSVALAYRLALNRVINSLIETIKTKDLLILDEPTDGFSADQLDRIRDVINELNLRQIIIVSHEPKIDTFVDNVIRLNKDHHMSSVVK